MTKSEIHFTVELDEQRVPEKIFWDATENPNEGINETKAISISVWDHYHRGLLGINLWTKDMPVDEMKRFFYETLQTMGDSFLKATGEKLIVEDLRDYCAHFADKMGINTQG